MLEDLEHFCGRTFQPEEQPYKGGNFQLVSVNLALKADYARYSPV